MMGLEEHLIGMFRHDFEFVEGHRSHLGGAAPAEAPPAAIAVAAAVATPVAPASAAATPAGTTAASAASGSLEAALAWTPDGEAQLARIPFFVRGKVRRNTERYAREHGLNAISEEVLFDAKAHYSA